MKPLYIILMLAISTHLFGAAAAGHTPQERFNNALQTGNVNLIVATFADLPHEARRETTENYGRFARFMRNNLPDIESTAYQGIINLYRNNYHPIARWVINGNPDRLDQQLEQFAVAEALVQDENAIRAPDPVIQQRLFDDAEEPVDQDFYEPLFHRQPQAQPVPEIPASRHQETLQSKIYRTLARAYLTGQIPLQRIINELQHANLSLPQFAIEVFFALNEHNAEGYYTIADLPEELRQYFHGVSLHDYFSHGLVPYIVDDVLFYDRGISMSLSDSFLASIDDLEQIPNINQVSELNLSNNTLRNLPDHVGNLSNLEEINLRNNLFTTFPDIISNLVNLKRIILNHNQLTQLPDTIGNLVNLEQIHLDNNQLTTLPNTIRNLVNLNFLYLPYNRFIQLPNFIGSLVHLYALDLSNNQLTTLPDTIGNLVNLIKLDVHNNQLTTLPSTIGNLVDLEQLDLSGNRFSPAERERITRIVHDATNGKCEIIWD